MWLRNCWYVIAWDHEIPASDSDALFSRKVLDEPILVYRTQANALVAIADKCCHRHAPLSKGRREGDNVRCGYHGMLFSASGECVDIPGIDRVPKSACVKTYPVAVKNSWVFVWMGDPEAADEAMLPDNYSCDHPDWSNIPGYMHYDTPYLLIADNLLDFSHLSYVHAKTLGGSPAIAQSRPKIERVDKSGLKGVRVTRFIPDIDPPPFYQRFRQFDGKIDRWFDYDFMLPSVLLMESGGRPVGSDPEDNASAVRLHSCQALTPETSTSTHYFFQQSHPSELKDRAVTESIYNSLLEAFNEDRDMITAQFNNLSEGYESQMVPLHFDAALIQFRKLLKELVEAEAQQRAPS